jgi:antitoxin component HigA of HigAB toxin-antitoxin module
MGTYRMIGTEEENERVLAIVDRLMVKGEKRSPEEDAILNLLTHLVEQFEEKAYPIADAAPAETIAFLLEQRGLKPIALTKILGSRAAYRRFYLPSARSAKNKRRGSRNFFTSRLRRSSDLPSFDSLPRDSVLL